MFIEIVQYVVIAFLLHETFRTYVLKQPGRGSGLIGPGLANVPFD